MKNQKRIIVSAMTAAVMLSLAACAETESSTSDISVEMKAGTYYLNGDTTQRAIILDTASQTIQFTNCDVEAYATSLLERELFDSEEGYQNVLASQIETMTAVLPYHKVDPSVNPEKDIFVYTDEILHGMMSFDYISDAQGTALIFGSKNVTEYILVETAS